MDSTTTGILLAALFLCVALSAFFSASETAFLASSKVRLKLFAQKGDKRAELALRLNEQYDRLLTTILVGNNIVNIAGTSIATVLFTAWIGGMGPTLSTIVMTVLVLIFGEVTPKTLAKQNAEQLAMRAARPLQILMTVLRPINWLFSRWKQFVGRVFRPSFDDTPIEEELKTIVDEAQQEGGMDAHEGDLIRSAIEFVDQDALDIMTPRVDVVAVEDTATAEEVENVFLDSGFSRLPVFHEDMDHMVGVLNLKDFHEARRAGEQDIRRMMTPAVYAPATIKISKLLRLCQSTRTHLVIVLDEFGGTEGIVSIEDVLEELVGEIYDENDDFSEDVVKMEDGSWKVNGGMPLTEFLEKLRIDDTFDADTVGGWAAEVLGHIPETGETFEAAGLQGQVTAMDKRRVMSVRLKRISETEDGGTES